MPHDRLALITGASRGLGAGLAEALAARGYHIMAVARTVGALEELDDRIQARGGRATLAPLDLKDPAQVQHMGQAIATRWGGVDLWCHTAIHGTPLSPAAHIAQKDMEAAIAINLTLPAMLIPMMEPLLRARTGQAVFFDDTHGGEKFFGSYGATKAAQIALARSWAAETATIGPKVSILSPRPMPTGLRARFFPGEERAPLARPRDEAQRLIDCLLPQPA
ncbi:SDR family NAD(P)-dependent oxidoreductase [Thioclava sp. GXIMD2076]|uniref:SDR family NAD(P)-dependent oxidoreductase n=1 Tax=Thioclava sp. GXIMD2076 TaxID=3131931 RepID=UPI0030CC7B98